MAWQIKIRRSCGCNHWYLCVVNRGGGYLSVQNPVNARKYRTRKGAVIALSRFLKSPLWESLRARGAEGAFVESDGYGERGKL